MFPKHLQEMRYFDRLINFIHFSQILKLLLYDSNRNYMLCYKGKGQNSSGIAVALIRMLEHSGL